MSLTPMYENIVVKPVDADEKTASGLYKGSTGIATDHAVGEVLAVGCGYRAMDGSIAPLTVKIGDVVIYRKGIEVSVNDDGEDLLLVSENNVLAVK